VWVQPREHEVVGAALAAARERAGLTQKELAKLLRKPQSFVRGHRRVDVLELLRIVEVLKGDARTVFMNISRCDLHVTRQEGDPFRVARHAPLPAIARNLARRLP
jgi:transcriptional regulator with XRE-family HTH domain